VAAPRGPDRGLHAPLRAQALVYYERFEDIRDAIQCEKTIKHWPRAWKARLIHAMNPEWDDLYETLNQ
jgi:putative endonuclease